MRCRISIKKSSDPGSFSSYGFLLCIYWYTQYFLYNRPLSIQAMTARAAAAPRRKEATSEATEDAPLSEEVVTTPR